MTKIRKFKIQIHKNEVKKKIKGKWKDVPEFITFETDEAHWIQVHEEL